MNPPMLLAPPTPTRSASPASASRQSSRRGALSSSTQRLSAASSSGDATYLPSPLPTPGSSRTPSPLFFGGRGRKLTWRPSTGGSESGTEADDELTKRLPAPPEKRKRTLSEEDKYYGEEEEEGAEDVDGRGRRRKRRVDVLDGSVKKKRRKGIVFVRRGIEVVLMGILVAVVFYNGGKGTVWREVVSWRIGRSSDPFCLRMESNVWRNTADSHQKSLPGYLSLCLSYSYIHFGYCFAKSLLNFLIPWTLHRYSIQHYFQYWFLYP